MKEHIYICSIFGSMALFFQLVTPPELGLHLLLVSKRGIFCVSCEHVHHSTSIHKELYKPSYLTRNKKENKLRIWLSTATPCKQASPEWSPKFTGPQSKQAVPHKLYSALISSECFFFALQMLTQNTAGLPNKWQLEDPQPVTQWDHFFNSQHVCFHPATLMLLSRAWRGN